MVVDRTKLPTLGPDPEFSLPLFQRVTLTNDVRLWTAESHRSPVFSSLLVIPSGSAADPSAQLGLAALTADLLDEGTDDRSAVEISEALSRIGGRLHTEVWSDATVLSLTTLARHATEGLALLASIASRPRFDPAEFDRVRDLRQTRLLQMRQVPSAVADRVFIEALYGQHPYGHLSIGTEESLGSLSVADVADFHQQHYMPSDWTLIAVGDLPNAELVAAADAAFGRLAWHSDFPKDDAPAAESALSAASGRLFFVERPGAVQSEIRLGHVGAPRSSPDYHALLVLNMVLGGQFVSRINLNLRETKGYTYGARTGFDWRLGRGPFSLHVSVKTSATADAISEAVKEITDIRDRRPVTDTELALARAALTRGFPRGFETAAHLARAAMQLAFYKLPEDEFMRFVPRIDGIDAIEVTRAAVTHLRPNELIAVIVGSRPDVFDSLTGLGFGKPVELINSAHASRA